MNENVVTDMCRLCPSTGYNKLLSIFDEPLSVTYNIKEVILVTTGVEILESDLVSKKICQRCCSITLKMFQFRQDALKQDRALKEMLNQCLGDKGIKLPNTCITVKKETSEELERPLINKENLKIKLHPTVANLYENYPDLKLPKKCFEKDISPVVSLTMGGVESYFQNRKLDIKKFIYKPGLKKQHFKDVAKKKTSYPAKQKTVAPLKISKKLLENNEQTEAINNYVCTPLIKKRGRKRKIVSTDNDKDLNLKRIDKKTKFVAQTSIVKLVTNMSKEASEQPNTSKSVLPLDLQKVLSTIPPQLPSSQIDPNHHDGKESSLEMTITDSPSKPEFIESLGLTPRIVTTKAQTLLVCNICGSVHNNALELNRHSMKHRVCQFCKRRFKSHIFKENHVDNTCQIKKVMNSPKPIVFLEKIHLNLAVRKKYMDAFSSFDPVPGLVEPAPLEHILIEAESPSPGIATDEIIILSEDEESPTSFSDPLSDIPTPAEIVPDINIRNSTVLGRVAANISDRELVKDLIAKTRPRQPATTEQMLQTDLPSSKYIDVNYCEGTCKFKNLMSHLSNYIVPVTVSSGAFRAFFKLEKYPKQHKSLACWDNLSAIDEYKKDTSKTKNISGRNKIVARQQDNKAVTSIPAASSSTHVAITTTAFPMKLPPPTYSFVPTPSTFSFSPTNNVLTTSHSSPVNLVVSNRAAETTSNKIVSPLNTANPAVPPDSLQNHKLLDEYPKQHKSMACWDNLSVIDEYKKDTSKTKNISGRNKIVARQQDNKAVTSKLVASSSTHVAITTTAFPMKLPPLTYSFVPTPSTFSFSPTNNVLTTSHSTPVNLVVSNGAAENTSKKIVSLLNTANPAVPPDSLQNHKLRKTVTNRLMSTPKTAVDVAPNKNTGSSNSYPAVYNSDANSSASVNENTVCSYLSRTIPNANKPVDSSIVRPDSSASVAYTSTNTPLSKGCLFATNTNFAVPSPPPINISSHISNSTPPTSNRIQFRVKNVWELQ